MKNLLFIAMMVLASLLFIVSGANAQYCSSFLPSCHWQETLGMRADQDAQELSTATSGEQQEAGEFMLAVPARQEGIGEMMATGSGRTTGQAICGYCSVFERGGFP